MAQFKHNGYCGKQYNNFWNVFDEHTIEFFHSNHETFFSAELSYYTGDRKAPYAYHHNQNLTNNTAEFKTRVKTLKTRGNVDSPESGMDALMQAIVCKGKLLFLKLKVTSNNTKS